jgi:hypothetical protein
VKENCLPAVLVELSLAAKRDRMEGGNSGDDKFEIHLPWKGHIF